MTLFVKTIACFLVCVFSFAVLPCKGSERAERYKNNGNRFFKAHQYTQAIDAFTKAIKDDPDYALAYFNRGLVYYDMGLYYKAIVDFDMVIMMNPNDKDAYFVRGLSYSHVEKLKLALKDVKKASSLGHGEAKAVLQRGDLTKKIEDLRSKQKKITTILGVSESPGTRESEVVDVDNEYGGNTIQTTYSKGDLLFDGSDGIFRQRDYFDTNERLKKTEQYHTAAFINTNNRNKTTIWYNDEFDIIKKEFTYTGKLLNHTGVYEYDNNGKLLKKTMLDKFGREVKKDLRGF